MTILPLLPPIKCHWVAMSCSYGKETSQEVLVRQLSVKVQIPSSTVSRKSSFCEFKGTWVSCLLHREENSSWRCCLWDPETPMQLHRLAFFPVEWTAGFSWFYLLSWPPGEMGKAISIPIRNSLNSVNKNIYKEETLGDTLQGNNSRVVTSLF